MLPKGKYPWYAPGLGLTGEAKSVFNSLGTLKDLPRIPAVAMEVQRLLQDPDVDARAVSTKLRADPTIAAQIIEMAETLRRARNPHTPPIKAIDHAVVYVGFKALGDLVITSSIMGLKAPESGFDSDLFWRDAMIVGAIAESLMRKFSPQLNQDLVYLAGSLCNIGKLVLAFCFPPLITKIGADVVTQPLLTWRQAERQYKFPDHCILGEIAASLWGFPVEILDATRHHHTLDSNAKAPLSLNEVVAAANQLSHWISFRPHRIEKPVLDAFQKRAGLTVAGLDEYASSLLPIAQSAARATA